MASYRKRNTDGPNSEDKALDLFAEMMIEKLETIGKDWKKPWFTEGALQWPRNLSGREYNGMNALMLMLHCEKEGYTIPRFCTFDCVQRLNKPGKDGEELPRVSVLKGEKSFPVMLTTFTCIHKETKEKIKYDDYKNLSNDEKEQYNVYPKMQVFRVFNVAQTNLKEARPELWEKLEKENGRPFVHEGEMFSFEPADRMIRDNLWICPINVKHQDDAFYSISKNEITVPEKVQFKDGEAFYGTLFHEMGHSTGAEGVLNRFKPTSFGSKEYSDEELVAELCGALISQRYGMVKHIKEDSCPYLKSWLDNLKESPQYIKTVLMDVKKASSMITQKIDQIARDIEREKTENQEQAETPKEKVYYASVAYLQMADDTRQLEELKDKGDYNGLLALAKEYYDGNGMDEQNTYASPLQNRGDDLLIEDQNFAVVYNGSVGGTFEVMLKYTEQEVRDHIRRYGIGRASNDVKEVAKTMVAEQFAEISQKNIPTFEMPNGEVLYISYNREKDTLDVGSATNAGLAVQHSFEYNHDKALDDNLTEVNEKLENMEEYREEEEMERSGFRR
ncbi:MULTISPECIES: zincin-like metallopeptidase domain-containing protein [Bacteroidales]|nr:MULTISPECIES: zincin-like metallopeptidase domain-containing protein [Bacteroidales]MCE8723511.1 ssDNA-binding domain-containing protein [Phocaeicola vulgatus]MCE8861336.1 ssDNA-binding domain-containing protein [Phocaeicola vulgatus]MCE9039972.1 ssDNA-binding domain-containing protein [Parabacteroides distasonis]